MLLIIFILLFFVFIFNFIPIKTKALPLGSTTNEVPVADKIIRQKETGFIGGILTKLANKIGAGNLISDETAWAAAKLLLSGITTSVINWAQSGFNNNPTFVTNPASFFENIADQASGLFLAELGLTNLCEPLWVRLIVPITKYTPFEKRASCTISRVIDNIQNFERNFENGGWLVWSEYMMPNNNIFGAQYEASRRVYELESAMISYQKEELNQGGGFLTIRKCIREDRKRCLLPGVSLTKEQCDRLACLEWGEVTPGNIIAGQVNTALGSSFRLSEMADEVTESLSAIIDEIIKSLVGKGLASISFRSGGGSVVKEVGVVDNSVPDSYRKLPLNMLDILLEQENNYKTEKELSISLIDNTLDLIEKGKNCFNDISTSTPSYLNEIPSYLLSQKEEINRDIAQSDLLISEIERYGNLVMRNLSGPELQDIISQIDDDLTNRIHSDEYYKDAVSQKDSLQNVYNQVQADYQKCLEERAKRPLSKSPSGSTGGSSGDNSGEGGSGGETNNEGN